MMRQRIRKLFLNDRFIMAVILINSCVIYAQVAGISSTFLNVLDVLCLMIFTIEMILKHLEYGLRGYWKDGWNRLDGILVILSFPALMELVIPMEVMDMSIFMILRLLRILRFFRLLHFFPNFTKVVKGFNAALRDSYAILLSFFVIIVIFGLINCSLFREADPEHFYTPVRSIYAVFQICTVEGWYEIPNTVAEYYGGTTVAAGLIRAYFCALLIFGGIIGMSFINSIFVDAMVSDNNDDVIKKLDDLQKQLEETQNTLNELSRNTSKAARRGAPE